MKKTTVLLLGLMLTCIGLQAKEPSLVPMPNKMKMTDGTLKLANTLTISYPADSLKWEADYLISFFGQHGKTVKVGKKSGNNHIALNIVDDITVKEGYKIEITQKGIEIGASTKEGIFRAITSLNQMLLDNKNEMPCLEISDAPRLEYRALMLDVARHFMPVDDVKRYIDQMARFKFNYLHIHLSDDQGWRIEIKKYPLLTQIGSKRSQTDGDGKPHSGFYTQDQLRELVRHAEQRHVEIIPEIDIPGHNEAAIAAYPMLTCRDTLLKVRTTAGVSTDILCAGNEKVFEMYTDIFNEVCDIFPSRYFHMGGDEAPLNVWKTCPKCQALKQKKGYKTDQELMGYFFERLGAVIAQKGKTPLFWYELDVPTYPKNTITFAWRMGLSPAVIERSRQMGYKVICAPGEHAYFDYPHKRGDHPVINWGMPTLSLKQVYKFDPGYGLPAEKQAHIMGVEATLWSECISDIDRTFYMTYPRAMALAEAGWSQMEVRNWDSFIQRIKPVMFDMIDKGINVRVPYEDFK